MNETTLREALADLPTPDPPVDLHARCCATIPGPRRFTLSRRVALVGVALAALLGAVLLPRTDKAPASGVAWADVQKAMDTVTVWHQSGRARGFAPDLRVDAPYWNNERRWRTIETWTDLARGERSRSGFTSHSMTLANGDYFDRQFDHVAVTFFGSRYWRRIQGQMRERLHRIVAGSGLADKPVIHRERTVWKGRPALRFDALLMKGRYMADRSILDRSETYVDPQSRRILAVRQYAVWTREPGHPERLTSESEFDYPERLDPALFDPKAFCKGAEWVHTQTWRGGRITVSPP